MASLFKSKRSRGGPLSSSTGSSETISSSSGRNSSLGSNRGGGGGEVSDLGQMSVPYDRLGPGGKVNEKSAAPTGRVISSPNTNPTLTVDGTNLNIHSSQLPTRRESTNSTTTVSSSSSRRDASNTTIEEGTPTPSSSYSPPLSSVSATPPPPPSSFYHQQQQQQPPSLGRTISVSSNSSSSYNNNNNPSYNRTAPQQQQQSSSYSTAGPSSSSYPDRSFSPTPSHRSEFGRSSESSTTTPSASIASRPSNQPISTSSRHGRTSSASGRYPTFQPSETSSVYSPSVYGDSTRERVERVAVSEEFHFPRPSKEEVDRMFEGLMLDRESSYPSGTPSSSSHTGSAASRTEMRALPDDKKWLLVLNGARIKWQQERDRVKRESQAKEMGGDGRGVYGRDSPEWYIQKFMDGSVTGKHVASLSVSLRTQPVAWFRSFIELQGQSVLANALGMLNHKATKKQLDIDLEYEIIKCLKILLNSKHGANDAITHPHVITHIACSLSSPNLPTRKLVADVLTFLCYWDKPRGHDFVIQGLKSLQQLGKADGKFDAWFSVFEATVDGRGRMGSLVGMSEDLRKGLGSSAVTSVAEGGLNDYAAANLFLIHAITTVCEELDVRVHLRAQMEACGVKRIISKLKDFGHSSMDRIILQIETEEQDDARELARDFNQDLLKDLSNPLDIFNAILSSIQGTRAQDFFLSSMQHLLLIRDDDDETRMRYFQLIDQLITSVVLDQKVGAGAEQDFSALMGVSVAKVVSRFADQDRLDKALSQASEMRATAQQLALEKAAVEEELRVIASSSGSGGGEGAGDRLALSQLNEKLASSEEHLKNSRLATKKLEADLVEMKKMYEERIASLELRIQELFNMLRESRGLENVVAASSTANGGVGAIDREQLVANLERQHEIKRTIEKLEGGYRNKKKIVAGGGGGTPEEDGAFDDDDEEDEEFSSEVASTAKGKNGAAAAGGKSTATRRAEVKSGSQFIDAEEERVREHIEASLAANLDKLNSPTPMPRSARNTDLRGSKIPASSSRKGSHLPPRFLEELNGRRFSRSASAPTLGNVNGKPSGSRSPDDGTDSDITAGTGSRASGLTIRTEDTSPSSTASSLERKSSLSGGESARHSRSMSGQSVSFVDTPKGGAGASKVPGEEGTATPPSLPTLQEGAELQISTGAGGESASGRPPNPFASVMAQIASKNKVDGDNEENASNEPTPPTRPPPRFNPMMAALHSQIKAKGEPNDDDNDEPPTPTSSASASGPPRPAFLGDISAGFQKKSTSKPNDDGSSEPSSPSTRSGPPRPAFLGSIGAGFANLKSNGSSSGGNRKSSYGTGSAGPTPPGTPGFDSLPSFGAAPTKGPRKDVQYKTAAKVKQLHWDKIVELKPDEQNVWSVTGSATKENAWAEKLKEMDIWSQMESTFSSQAAKMQIDKQKQVELMSVLEPKVKRMVEIFMKGFKIDDPQEISAKILSCDEVYCSQTFLENMQKFLPSPEQVGKLNSHKSDTVAELLLLHPADRLMVHLIKIPRLEARVNGMLYRARFEERISLFEEAADQTIDASLALQEAPKFRELLSLILLIGNYLNGNSYAGGAFGFKISSINKLVETKSPQGQNLLHFLERTVSNLFQEMEGFLDELDKAAEGSRHELRPVGEGVADLFKKLDETDREIKAHLTDEPIPGDRYAQRMLRFLADARERLDALNDKRITAESTYNAILKYFGEDPMTASNTFFGIFKTFVTSYKQCQKQNLTWAELEAAKLRRKEAAEVRAREKAERDAKIDESAPVMDNIMDSLKSMTPRRNRRAGRSASGGPPTSLSTSSTMLPLDLGGAGAGGEFGGQAMSILNTLRSRGFGSLGTTVEEQKEEVAPTPSSTGEEEEVKEDDDASVGDETMSDGPGDETLASLAVDDEEEEEEEGEGDLTVVLDSPPSEFDHEEEDSPSPSPK